MKNFLKLRNQFGFCFFFFFFQILCVRGRFTVCVAYNYTKPQVLYLWFWPRVRVMYKWGYKIHWEVPLYYYIKIMYYNFFQIEFCTKSALQRCKYYSTIQICLHFASRKVPSEIRRRVQIWMGKMTTSVLKHINIFFYSESNCTILPIVANFFYSGH